VLDIVIAESGYEDAAVLENPTEPFACQVPLYATHECPEEDVPRGFLVVLKLSDTLVGSGTAGVDELDAEDAVEVPFAFVAVTVNVYPVPFERSVTEIGDDEFVPVIEDGEDVAVNVETAFPPVAPAVKETSTRCDTAGTDEDPMVGA